MQVLKYPDPRLFKPCLPVTHFNEVLEAELEGMWETMKRERGMGMAANQVGLDKNMFVMTGPNNEEKLFIVNPVLLAWSTNACDVAEGCLSAPGELIKLYRPSWVMIDFKDEKGAQKTRVFSGIFSVCVHHEMEHLEGKTFLQNKGIPKSVRKSLAKKWGFTSSKVFG